MPLLNYTTQVNAQKTVSEIQEKLMRAGAKRIILDADDEGNPSAVSFSVNWNGDMIFFRLPCEAQAVLAALAKAPEVPRRLCTLAQAYRVSWRIIKDWTEAQLAMVEADQAKLHQVFLQYGITKNGDTLYEALEKDRSSLLLTQ